MFYLLHLTTNTKCFFVLISNQIHKQKLIPGFDKSLYACAYVRQKLVFVQNFFIISTLLYDFREKHFEGTPFGWLFLVFLRCYSNTELTVKKILTYFAVNFLPTHILDFLQNIIWAFWIKRTRKKLKIVCVKFIGKIGCTLVVELVYVIVHRVKSVCRTL